MASETTIVNSALVTLGVATISALTDDSPQARLANRVFDEVRDEMLRDHPWSWATKRVSIAASGTAPAWEYTNAFPLPPGYLRLVSVYNPAGLVYQIELTTDGPVIVTDIESPLKIAYVSQVTDVWMMDGKFREAMSRRFAMDWAEPLTGISKLTENMAALYVRALAEAKAVGAQEDYAPEIEVETFITSRY